MIVRPATPGDAAALAAVQRRTWLAAFSEYVDPETILAASEDGEARWLRILEDGSSNAVAAVTGGVAGFASWGPSRDARADEGLVGELYAIYVSPDAQGAGVGTLLHADALAQLRRAGFLEATLWVFERNAQARTFYERAGWTLDPGPFDADRWDWAPSVRYRRDL